MIVYLITNKINGKRYVGQTVETLETRWKKHCSPSSSNKKMLIVKAIKKYGEANFSKKVLAKCDSIEEMNHRETYYIKLLKTSIGNGHDGYNVSLGGGNMIPSEETRKKMSNAKKGKVAHNKGKKAPPHVIIKLNEGKKRYHEKFGNPSLGRKATPETLIKMSQSHIGKKLTEEQKIKISSSNTGKKRTAEHKSKYSESKNYKKIKVLCHQNNTIYNSQGDAAKDLRVPQASISQHLSGKTNLVAKKYTFSRVVENKNVV